MFRSAVLLSLIAIGSAVVADDDFLTDFLHQHCTDCHSATEPSGSLNLDSLTWQPTDPANLATWIRLHDRVRAGEMPPPEDAALHDDQRTNLTETLALMIASHQTEQRRSDGRVQYRRLNRYEYENWLRDSLKIPNLQVRDMLPPDGSRHGFDNVSSALEISDVQMSRYLDASAAAIDEIMDFGPKPQTKVDRFLAKQNGRFKQVLNKAIEAVPVGDAVGLLRQGNSAQAPTWLSGFAPPKDGIYRIRTKMFGFIWDRGDVLPADRIHAVTYQAVQGTIKRPLATRDIVRNEKEDCVHEVEAFLRVGDEIQFWFGTLDDRNKKKTPLDQYTAPGVAVEWIEVEGPIVGQWPTEGYRVLFDDLPIERWTPETGLQRPKLPFVVRGVGKRAMRETVREKDFVPYHVVSANPHSDSRRLLNRFAGRIYCSVVTDDELTQYQALIDEKISQKVCFQEAMRIGFIAVLCSPDLLFRREQPGRLDETALAARLSLMLWSSCPDEELLRLAGANQLRDQLPEQVERMLSDPRIDRFVENFAGQWLDLRRITVTEPDEQLYPDYDRLLLSSMVDETHAYVHEMLRLDLGAISLIDSDFAMINQRLADLYQIPGVEGFAIRKIALPPNSPRGGIITQASVLKVTANGTTTSPVTRGAWFLDRIYGQPALPPPPGIPAVEPDLRGTTTIRQQLEKHRDVEACAGCHRNIDPPGFALESFDVIGGFRERYRSLGGEKTDRTFKDGRPVAYRLGLPVDAAGVSPDGRSFSDIHQFRDLLQTQTEPLTRNLIERLVTYATGEGIQFADRPEIDRLVKQLTEQDGGMRTMIHAIVQSELFQNK